MDDQFNVFPNHKLPEALLRSAASLLNWWRVAVLFFGERGRKGGGSPSAPSVSLVGSIESFTLEPDLQLQARSDRIVLGVL